MPKILLADSLDGQKYPFELDEIKWRPSVYAIILRDGKLLVSPQHGMGFDLPGGGVDVDETCVDAVVRETKEETGMDVKVIRFVDMLENFFAWKPGNPNERKIYHSLCLYYLCEVIGGEISMDGFDEQEMNYAQKAEWFDVQSFNKNTPIASTVDFRPIVLKLLGENIQ